MATTSFPVTTSRRPCSRQRKTKRTKASKSTPGLSPHWKAPGVQMEPDTTIPKNLFFYTDGGAIKIFGRSYPTIRNVEIVGNYASPCGAGISVQHQGFNQD